MHRIPGEIPQHKTKNIKLMAIVHRLQQIMVNENLTPDELVGCAQIVRDNYERLNDMIQLGTFQLTIPFWGQPR
ncbi:hypothetical protein E1852_12130 [Salmonella enterica subsp. enterica serovar Minnesota]|nr:hypothetical protein [Salmonella enterica subsp. enterica serovar Minnesota]EDW4065753.1 hypothetical protein [Salmonella enterica subsp. enterica serovar Minnesota]